MFVVAVFMESAIKAILVPVRAPDRQKIAQELADIKRAAETDDTKKEVQIAKECELEIIDKIGPEISEFFKFSSAMDGKLLENSK